MALGIDVRGGLGRGLVVKGRVPQHLLILAADLAEFLSPTAMLKNINELAYCRSSLGPGEMKGEERVTFGCRGWD